MSNSTDGAAPAASRPGAGLRRALMAAAFAGTFIAGALTAAGVTVAAVATGMQHGGMHAMVHAHIEKMLTEVDATPDQKARIDSILKGGMQSITPLHAKLAEAHGDLHRLLTAPVIDRAALEQLRAARMGDLDQASKVLVQTIADAADVLTPGQRAKVATLMAEHRHPHS